MNEVDTFATNLLEEAKRFFEKAVESKGEGKDAFLHAALLLGFASLEAHVNSIAADFLVRPELSTLDNSILQEREVQLEDGQWTLTDKLKIYRLEDRIEYLHRRFSITPLNKQEQFWSDLKAGMQLRNRLTHPKGAEAITEAQIRPALMAIVAVLDSMYRAIYKRPFPAAKRGLQTLSSF